MKAPPRKRRYDDELAAIELAALQLNEQLEGDAGAKSSGGRRRIQRGALVEDGDVWRLRWRDPPAANGKRARRSLVIGDKTEYRTRRQAREEASRLMLYLARPSVAPGRSPTFEHVCKLFAETELPLKSKGTARNVAGAIANHFLPYFGTTQRVHEILPASLQAFIVAQIQASVRFKTRRTRYSYLLMILSWAASQGFAVHLPRPNQIKLGRSGEAGELVGDKAYTPEEAELLLARASFPHRALYAIVRHTGARVGEALALTWADLDLAATAPDPVVRVRASVIAAENAIGATKSQSGVRDVPLPPALREILLEYRAWLGRRPPALVFPGRDHAGRPLTESGVLKQLTSLAREHGLKKFGRAFHGFRHLYAQELSAAGAPPEIINAILGWRDFQSAQPYLRARAEQVRKFAAAAAAARALRDRAPAQRVFKSSNGPITQTSAAVVVLPRRKKKP
ncbi:MAG TPA: site-specific integrase [Gammaproteobacteria bacterium]|nr:site-specific integrase [Gammaproteobacteria bacterium]